MLLLKMTKRFSLGLLTFASMMNPVQASEKNFYYDKLRIVDQLIESNSPHFVSHIFSESKKIPLNKTQVTNLLTLKKDYNESLSFLRAIKTAKEDLHTNGISDNTLQSTKDIVRFDMETFTTYRFSTNIKFYIDLMRSLDTYSKSILLDPSIINDFGVSSFYITQLIILSIHAQWINRAGSFFNDYIAAVYKDYDDALPYKRLNSKL